MSRLRIMLVSIVVGFAVAGIASASASAAACVPQAGAICQENMAGELVEQVTVLVKKEPATAMEVELEGISKVECTTMESDQVFAETPTGILILPFLLSFEGCALATHANCEVLETGGSETGHISTHGIEGTYAANEGTSGDLNFRSTGTLFAEYEIAGGTCLQAAKVTISGSQLCLLLLAETLAVTHLLECTVAGSSLKNGTKIAKFAVTAELTAISPAEAFQYLVGSF